MVARTDTFKVYSVTADAGAHMPDHISTKEAVVFIKKGRGVLIINGKKSALEEGGFTIIPGNIVHSLDVEEDFNAMITMATDSQIEFR